MNAADATRNRPAFLITVDTEGDDLWGRPRTITTRNTACLPRFQRLCEDFDFKPTWLTNHEMAMDPDFVAFGRDAEHRGTAEIGMHLHAWNSPPLRPLTRDDFFHQPFLIEYPDEVLDAKIGHMSRLLRERFEGPVVSHRAGRWALNSTYAQALVRHGYQVDCSVSPHVSWAEVMGDPNGQGGSDYRGFPDRPYLMDLQHIDRPGHSPLLELPVSVLRSRLHRIAPLAYRLPVLRRSAWRHQPDCHWLYPNGHNLGDLLCVVREAVSTHRPCIELVLHSSELMPGGSPATRDGASLERLYTDLRALFTVVATAFVGMTLARFRQVWLDSQAQASALPPAFAAQRPMAKAT
ncbi:MAG: deacetylase [Leptothrix sp. (in: b-proteobacteria)]